DIDGTPSARQLDDRLEDAPVRVGIEVLWTQELLHLIEGGRLEQNRAQHRGFGIQIVGRDAPRRRREILNDARSGRGLRPEAHRPPPTEVASAAFERSPPPCCFANRLTPSRLPDRQTETRRGRFDIGRPQSNPQRNPQESMAFGASSRGYPQGPKWAAPRGSGEPAGRDSIDGRVSESPASVSRPS